MSNMSYCRWENTSNDMAECVNNMEEIPYDSLDDWGASEYEKRGYLNALRRAAEMLEYASPAHLEEAGVDLKRLPIPTDC